MATFRSLIPIGLSIFGVMVLVGCIIVPASPHLHDHGHKWVAEHSDRQVQAGKYTKAHVMEKLGKPDVILAEGRVLAYSWTTNHHKKILFASCYGTKTVHESNDQTHYLLLEFDAADVLTRKQIKHGGRTNKYATNLDDAVIPEPRSF